MELNTQEQLKAHLMATNDEFRHLAEKHQEYHHLIAALEAKPHLTEEELLEEARLKKLKLRLKDQMSEMVSRYRTEHVS